MAIESRIAEARDRQGLSQGKLACDLNYSRTTVGKWENGDRKIPDSMYSKIAMSIDDEQYYFECWSEKAGIVSIPLLNGDYIEQRSANMKYLVQSETNEALEHLNKPCWYKPIRVQSSAEKDEMKQVIKELLDAAASMINLVAVICKEYNFSMRDVFQQWRITLKARRMEK